VTTALFELESVSLSRAGRPVLQDVTASLPGGACAVVGPSGSGKSSLLRLLNRLADPDRGTVAYRGRDVADYQVLALRREVCLVPQLPALLDGSVADNVVYGARLAGHDTDVAAKLELVGLGGDFAGRDAARLSVGEQQRVMLARALALEPAVLLLDEPTSALDERSQSAVETTLAQLERALDISLVLVTHDAGQAQRLADWTLRLEGGRVVDVDGRR
jgi:ABC-type methionine transport system ATPase subunit